MILILGLLLLGTGDAAVHECSQITGVQLKQVDAGAGQVCGVTDRGQIYIWTSNGLKPIHAQLSLSHVTVGPAGFWGVDKWNRIYNLSYNSWTHVGAPYSLKQIDAGGNRFLSGVDAANRVYCLNQGQTLSRSGPLNFTRIDLFLKYYSCGLYGCWGVNNMNAIYYRHGVLRNACQGLQWKKVEGSLTMVEVGTDGSVYGVNAQGNVYKRTGISANSPAGLSWSMVPVNGHFRHVSYDNGRLWLLCNNGDILVCSHRDDDVL